MSGAAEGSTPKNSGGATPITVKGMLSTRIGCPIAFGGPPKRFWLAAKLITATGAAPERSSSESIRRPAAGDTARPRKYSPVTYSTLAVVACPRTARLRVCPLKYPKSVEKTGFSLRSVSNAALGEHPADHLGLVARPENAL